MTYQEGKAQGLMPIRDFIPYDALCVVCEKPGCDVYSVQGLHHHKCRNRLPTAGPLTDDNQPTFPGHSRSLA